MLLLFQMAGRGAPVNILALDLASTTGFATEVAGHRRSGYKNFTPLAGEGPGWRYIRFNVWLYSWKVVPWDLVVIEKALPRHVSALSAEIAFGLSTRVTEFCERQNVKLVSVHGATLKKWACGKGNGTKEDMLRAAQRQLGIKGMVDDNEIDALWLLHFAQERIRKSKEVGQCVTT